MLKIANIIGARPQFIKATVISREIKRHNNLKEIIIHTGQHFDRNMSDVFFEELGIPKPHYDLDINSLSHGAMTGQMLDRIEDVLLKERPDFVLVYGDANTTLAGALAAKKLHIKVAHIEAGLRSFNMDMPEEVNRVLTDRISDILFCPTESAVNNLRNEGFQNFKCRIIKSGDVMQEAAYLYSRFAQKPDFNIPKNFVLATIHRAENTDNTVRLKTIFKALSRISKEIDIILPLHPRTKQMLKMNDVKIDFDLKEPLGYLEMIYLLKKCNLVITDSGGLQKEAFFFKKPCVTLRDQTEWMELVEQGVNLLAGSNPEDIYNRFKELQHRDFDYKLDLYGNKEASKIIVEEVLR